MKYFVTIKEIFTQSGEVEAKSSKEAIALLLNKDNRVYMYLNEGYKKLEKTSYEVEEID